MASPQGLALLLNRVSADGKKCQQDIISNKENYLFCSMAVRTQPCPASAQKSGSRDRGSGEDRIRK